MILGLRQKQKYGGLDENSPHRFKWLNAWQRVGGTIWERLGSVTLMEAYHWGWLWGFRSPFHSQLPLSASRLWSKMWAFRQYHTCCHAPYHDGHGITLWNCMPQIKALFHKLSWSLIFITSKETLTKTKTMGFCVAECIYLLWTKDWLS